MPKRNAEEKIEHYKKKIRKLEENSRKKTRRNKFTIMSSDSEDNAKSENNENVSNQLDMPVSSSPPLIEDTLVAEILPDSMPMDSDLDPNILAALGEAHNDSPEYGEKIHDNLAKLWLPILKKGIPTDNKDNLLKNYLIPENCVLLQAPLLNPEITAALSESSKFRDKKMLKTQQQLGAGMTAVNRGLQLLVNNGSNVDAIKAISDGCRILSDLHHQNTLTRIKFITSCLDKSFLQIIENWERDTTLFGNNLSEKINASKIISKQGQQLKKTLPTLKPSFSGPPTNSKSNQGNWVGPSRFQSNRGGRGGYKRINTTSRAPPAAAQPATSYKPRAPTRRR